MSVRQGTDMGSQTLYEMIKVKLGAYIQGYPEGVRDGYYQGRIEMLGHRPFSGDAYDDGYNDGHEDARTQAVGIGITITIQGQPPQSSIISGSFAQGQMQGIAIGEFSGFDEGFDKGFDYGTSDGFVAGLSSAPVGSGVASVIGVTSLPLVPSDPLIITIYNTKSISFYHVTCQDGSNGPRYTVWDPYDAFFSFPFDNTRSTLTGAGTQASPYIFTIFRLGGWPTGLSLDVRARAVDKFGNEVDS